MATTERWLLLLSLFTVSAYATAGKSPGSEVADTPEDSQVAESNPVAFPPLSVYLPASSPFVGGQGHLHRAPSIRPKERDKDTEPSIPYLPSQFNQDSAPYSYEYHVRDDHRGTLFGHTEAGKGSNAEGGYYVHLPDGRVQMVKYYTNDDGFHSEVDYVGSDDHKVGDHSHGKSLLGRVYGRRRIPLVDHLSQQIFGLEAKTTSTTPTPKPRPLPSRDYSNPKGLIKRLRGSPSTKAPVTLQSNKPKATISTTQASWISQSGTPKVTPSSTKAPVTLQSSKPKVTSSTTKAPVTLQSNKPKIIQSYLPLLSGRPIYTLNGPLSLYQSVHASQRPVIQYQAPGGIYLDSIPSAIDFESVKSKETIPTRPSTISRVPELHNTNLPRLYGLPTPTKLYGLPAASYLPPTTTSYKHVDPQRLYDLPTTQRTTTAIPSTVGKTLEITGPHPDEVKVLNIEELDEMALETSTEPIPEAQGVFHEGDLPPHFNTNLSFDISNTLFRDVAEAADLEPGPRGHQV